MLAYILLFSLVLCIIFMQSTKTDYYVFGKSVCDLFLMTVFIIFYSVRYEIGYDYSNYVSIITQEWHTMFLLKMEYLSYLFMDFASQVGEPHVFFVLIAIVSIPLLFYSLSAYSETNYAVGWGILLFLSFPFGFIYSLSVSRQFAAVAILLFGTRYLIARQLMKYFLCVCMASLFHISSLAVIFAYFVTSEKFKFKYLVILFFCLMASFFALKTLLIYFFPAYEAYLLSSVNDHQDGLSQVVLYTFTGILFVIVKPYLSQYKYYNMYLKLYLFGLVLNYSFVLLDPTMGIRLATSFYMYSLFLIGYFFQAFSVRSRFFLKLIGIVVMFVLYTYGFTIAGDTYLPYKTIF
ncbi:MAG: EpsG family protein [Selenomonadaceae bacterium]|nr:EpsG family protein [Selenomonadaceae bacterium]